MYLSTEGSKMRLVYLPVNIAWAFVFGGRIVSVGDTRVFLTRSDAVQAARRQGLTVGRNGVVSC